MNTEGLDKHYENMQKRHNQLLANIKANLPNLEKLLERMSSHWNYEDPIYRFYYQSYKIYSLQDETREIVDVLRAIAPEGQVLCGEFEEIIKAGASEKNLS